MWSFAAKAAVLMPLNVMENTWQTTGQTLADLDRNLSFMF